MAENELILEPEGEGSFKFTFVSDRRALAGRVGMGVEGPPDRRSKEDNGRRRKTSKGGKPRERGRQSCRALPRFGLSVGNVGKAGGPPSTERTAAGNTIF